MLCLCWVGYQLKQPQPQSVSQSVSQRPFGGTGGGEFPCDYCGKTYDTKGGLRTRIYSHNNQEVANEQEIVENIYSSFMESQYKVVKEIFPCEECGKTYGTEASLRTHKYNQGQEHS